MLIGKAGGTAAPGGAGQKAHLHQVGLTQVLQRHGLLAQRRRQRFQAHRATVVHLNDGAEQAAVQLVQTQRYKLDAETLALPPYELLEAIGRKRGLLVRGGEVNTERCAIMLVDEFRACKWGRISLERPPQRDDLVDFAEEDEE